MPPRRPPSVFPDEVLLELAQHVYDPRPIAFFAPHIRSRTFRPARHDAPERKDLSLFGSVSRRFRAVAKPLLFGSAWLRGVDDVKHLLDLPEDLKFLRYLYIDFGAMEAADLLRFLLLLQSLLNQTPSLLHTSFQSEKARHHGEGACDLTLFVLPAIHLLPNLLSLELVVPCNRCCSHLLGTFRACPQLHHLKITESLAKPLDSIHSPSFLNASDPGLFPVGLRVLFVAVASRSAPRTEIVKRLQTNCPLLEELRIHCPKFFSGTRVAKAVTLEDSTFFPLILLLGAFKNLHTVDLDELLPTPTPWSPSPSEKVEDAYEVGTHRLDRAWEDHGRQMELYLSEVTMRVRACVPKLRRFWWNLNTQRFDGAVGPSSAKYRRYGLELENAVFQIVQVRDRAAYVS